MSKRDTDNLEAMAADLEAERDSLRAQLATLAAENASLRERGRVAEVERDAARATNELMNRVGDAAISAAEAACTDLVGESAATLRSSMTEIVRTVQGLCEERDEARAEVERLRARPCAHDMARDFSNSVFDDDGEAD
jgi:uncharacterized coiled-coil DUF342 family protein